ncbi:ABC transporter substrate-binding protein [Acuticoccus mangrovi]|uniref:ABC transporter substrate-binding protein n=1 Tax=Acuticoccus mangrovi TaxID=2796142 RepID=A0A934ITU5_9HYPH|nr:ABC transporter substrate-binding protein [Acuticoccus mangrovi]MBJ3778716.1 ABC transporter substrate-binding protein [Acuticoccus mangrovi]
MVRDGGRGTLTRRTVLGAIAAAALPAAAARADDLRFAHAFGETVLPAPARRVVSLGYTTQDPLLALGVAPLAVRGWFGDMPFGVFPWAQPLLGDAEPVVLVGEVSMERVAALAPDLVVAIGSGISEAEYGVLSRIAPTLVHEKGVGPYGTPWDHLTRTIGRAVGKAAAADALVAGVRETYAAARARHPGWADKTGVAAYHYGGETGAFILPDTRASVLAELGFRPTPAVAALSGPDEFYAALSPEDLSPLDADVLVWVSSFGTAPDLVALPMRKTLNAYREGREVYAGPLAAAAMSFGSVLSLPFVLDLLEADIAAAADGLPETPVASAAAAGLAP